MRGFPTAAILVVALFSTLGFFSSLFIQSSYAQFFNLPEEPITEPPPTTTTTSPTTTPTPGAPGTPQDPEVIIDRPTAAALAAQDPYFAQFEKVLKMCMDAFAYGNVSMTGAQCADSLKQGADRWCGIQYFDSLKCEYASAMTTQFNKIAGILGRFGMDEIPSFNELFPDSPSLFSPKP